MRRGHAHFPELSDEVKRGAAEQLADQRAVVADRGLCPPGGAEDLDLLRALHDLAETDEDRQSLLSELARFTYGKHPPDKRRGGGTRSSRSTLPE